MADADRPLLCRDCQRRIALHELIRVTHGEGIAVEVTTMELRADPGRYRRRKLRLAHVECSRRSERALTQADGVAWLPSLARTAPPMPAESPSVRMMSAAIDPARF